MNSALTKVVDSVLKPVDWRAALQAELNTNNALRSQSLRRVGDALTETSRTFPTTKPIPAAVAEAV